MRMKRYVIFSALLALPLGLMAQNLNPEVQVTNEYETQVLEVEKQGLTMTVPDSMLRFDYHFDYSVFDSPYKGAYEFSPYVVSISPSAKGYDGRKLYLRAGAGWVLKPELDFVWATMDGKKASMNVFASGKGFYGRYLGIAEETFASDRSKLHWGWDFDAKAGAETRISLGQTVFRGELAYDGIFFGHALNPNDVSHAPYAKFRFTHDAADDIYWSVAAKYRYINDSHDGWAPLQDHDVQAEATIAPEIATGGRGWLDLFFNRNSWYVGAAVRPHASFRLGNWDFDAGLRVSWNDKYGDKKFGVSPDVKVALHLLRGYLDVYAGAVGQDHMLGFWDYKSAVHHYYHNLAEPIPVREIADLYLGGKGFTDFGLRYDLRAGYRFMENVPLWGVGADGREALIFQDACNMLHADMDLAWKCKHFDVEGSVHYLWLPYGVEERTFAPASVKADLKVSYNWKERIYAGISGAMSTSRTAEVADTQIVLPWYLDLGVWAEYRFNSKVSVWLKGSNLLNHEIRQSPMYCQYGPAVIAGVRLSL